jgi:predicted amidohydrolase
MKRRTFLRNTAIGMTAFAGAGLAGLKAEALQANQVTDPVTAPGMNLEHQIGRPVEVVSIGFPISNPLPMQEIAELVDQEGSRSPDIIVLPETCQGQNAKSEEPLHGPTITAMVALAKKHKVYIAVPIDRGEGGRRLNTVVLIDRSGEIAVTYDKVFPYWSEFDLQPAVSPGGIPQVYQAEFGRIGFATCFDANFPEVWNYLSEGGVELVLWPSAYSAGRSLQAHAINHHYYIVSSTQVPDCIVYDITGDRLLHAQEKGINISRVTLDLDRGIYHQNFNLEKRDKLLKEHSADVMQEKWMEEEQWFVLKAKRPGVSARQLARQYGLEELRHYIERSRSAIDHLRGWEFAERARLSEKA